MDGACEVSAVDKEIACGLPDELVKGEPVRNGECEARSSLDGSNQATEGELPQKENICKGHFTETIVEAAKVHNSQSEKARSRSGILNFGTIREKKQDHVEEKPLVVSPNGSKQRKSEMEVRRSSRKKKLFVGNAQDTTASHKGIFVAAASLHKQQDCDAMKSMEILYDKDSQAATNDFFIPASKKSRMQKQQESTSGRVATRLEFCKSESSLIGVKRPREEELAQSMKGPVAINTKQPLKNEDFFKPVSEKLKHVLSNAMKIQHPKVVQKSDTSVTVFDEDGNSSFHFDLRMEAKLAAEENAQLCAGKPTHPFFAQHKIGQRASNCLGVAIDGGFSHQASSFVDAEELDPSPPFHVTQIVKMEAGKSNWQSCEFLETHEYPLKGECCGSSANDIGSLLRLQLSCEGSKTLRERRLYGHLNNNGLERLEPLVNYLKKHSGKQVTSDEAEEMFLTHLESRLSSYYSARECSLESLYFISSGSGEYNSAKNLLWTDVYQPQSPEEVCGNRELVESLNGWLENWTSKCVSSTGLPEGDEIQRKSVNAENIPEDAGWFQEDSDSDGKLMEDEHLRNVLCVAGPVGSGKTAAIYACARSQGYTVIEVNSSDNRSGMLIKNKFGEAMESHRLKKCVARKSDGCAAIQNERNKEEVPAARLGLISETEEVLCERLVVKENHISLECESKAMTVMLFEDVDMVFEEDRGFTTALVQLAETTKRPIILTSNDKEICLPHTLGAHSLGFKRPSTEELVSLAYMVCGAEGISCSPEYLERVVKVCEHDIRKLLNFLQFWCQGCLVRSVRPVNHEDDGNVIKDEKEIETDNTIRSQDIDTTIALCLFDLEAQHRIWPSFIPLGFPCCASELIGSKLSAAVFETEKRLCSAEEKKFELEAAQNVVRKKLKRQRKDGNTPVKDGNAERDEREGLSTNESNLTELCLSNGCLLTPLKSLKEAKALARSPILRRTRRQLAIVMTDSDSDDSPNMTQKENHFRDLLHTGSTTSPGHCLVKALDSENKGTDFAQGIKCCHDFSATENNSSKDKSEIEQLTPAGMEGEDVLPPLDACALPKEINESYDDIQQPSHTGQGQEGESSGVSKTGALVNAIDVETQSTVYHDVLQVNDSSASFSNTALADALGACRRSVPKAMQEAFRNHNGYTSGCPLGGLKDDHGKNLSSEVRLEDGSSLMSGEFCSAESRKTLALDCLTSMHSEAFQNSNLLVGFSANTADLRTEGGEFNDGTQSHTGPSFPSSEAHPQSVSEAVHCVWSHFRVYKEESGLKLDPDSKDSLPIMVSLSKLVESISACDVISTMHVLEDVDFEEDVGSSSYIESPSCRDRIQTCGQIAHTSLQLCIRECCAFSMSIEESSFPVSPQGMMLAMNDACTLGKLAAGGPLQIASCRYPDISPSSLEQDSKRLANKSAVQHILCTGLPPRAQRALLPGAAFHEYASFIARIGHLEQARLASGFARRRNRQSQHYFSTHPWDLSEESINILQQLSSFDST